MHRTNVALLLAVLVFPWCWVVGAAESERPDGSRVDFVGYAYRDGNVLLTLVGTDLEKLEDIEAFDLSGAPPEQRERVLRELEAGIYDGVFLGVPAPGDIELAAACGTLPSCAREVVRFCAYFGSKGASVSIRGGCSGTCTNGVSAAVLCAEG